MKVLTINSHDSGGGAAVVARSLHQAFLEQGIDSRMLVGTQQLQEQSIAVLDHRSYLNPYSRMLLNAADSLRNFRPRIRGAWRLSEMVRILGEPARFWEEMRGTEDFRYPGTWQLLKDWRPDIIHCHNLHGRYFDLRALSWLSTEIPVVLTLHDAWLLSGHCAHSMSCERWKSGCGSCPDLQIYPEVRRDNTAYNWNRKKQIFDRSKVYAATPCRWLMSKVEQSILSGAIVESRVIPFGVDPDLFCPADRAEARSRLGLPQNASILCSVGYKFRSNPFKGYPMLRSVVDALAARNPEKRLILLVVGDSSATEKSGENAEIRYCGLKEISEIAPYYQASDVYLQTSVAETFPNSILEALACAVPIVATAVGGIPEQIKDGETGILVPPGESTAMTEAVERLLIERNFARMLGENARQSALTQFSPQKHVESYVEWYRSINCKQLATALK